MDWTPPPGVIQSTRKPAGVVLLRNGPSTREAAGEEAEDDDETDAEL